MHLYHLHIKYSLHMCERVQGSQIFKWNSIISIHSKVIAFLVISLSPHGPHIVPVIPTSSPHYPRHPHVIPIAPRRSPCGPHGCGLCGLRGLHPMLSLCSPRHPRHPHTISTLFRRSPHHPQPPRYPLYLPPTLLGEWEPRISKNAIRFELIEIF